MCMDWLAAELSWLPILVGLLLLCSMLIPYCIAVSLNHVTIGLPFISDTGTLPPESCVFGQLLNMTAAAAAACIFIRFKQVHIAAEGNPKVARLNAVGLVLGLLACLGMSLVANFQETNVLAVHTIGAMMCFGLGSIYEVVHTWVTFRLHSHGLKTYFRLLLSVCSIILFILTFTFTTKALAAHKGAPDPLIWYPDDKPQHLSLQLEPRSQAEARPYIARHNVPLTFHKRTLCRFGCALWQLSSNLAPDRPDVTAGTKAIAAHTDAPDPLIWYPTDKGYTQHQVATISEWLMAISFLLYFWTFIPEFRWLCVTVEVSHDYQRLPGVDSSSTQDIPEL